MDLNKRRRYVKLVDTVREAGGEVKLFSSLHVSGERKIYPMTWLSSIGNAVVVME